ncbi:hypothetical protein JCM5350_004967 [Sporobolomyces pararoseus]
MSTSTTTAEGDGFTPVTYKKPSRAPKNRKGKNRFRERTLEEKLAAREEALNRSGYLVKCRELLRNSLRPDSSTDRTPSTSACPAPRTVVCLGLGSVTDSTKAQDQYVLLKELILELGDLIDKYEPVQFYDPVFSPEDSEYLSSQGHIVLSSDFPLRLRASTFLYIPHGPRSLFNQLIEQNWSADQLCKMIIFGNRLDLYDDPTYSGTTSQSGEGKGELEGGMEWIRRAAPLFSIEPLPSTKDHLEAFNDLALEWVEPTKLEQAVKKGKLPHRLVHDTMPRQVSEADRDNEVKNDEAEKSTRTEEMTEALDSLNFSATTTTTTEKGDK